MNDRFVAVSIMVTGSRIRGCFSKPRCGTGSTQTWPSTTWCVFHTEGSLLLWLSDADAICDKIEPHRSCNRQ